jgi:hypothetical protein
MSVIDVIEDWAQASVEEEAGRIGATRVFTVLFDDGDAPESRVLLARNAPGVPTPWARHPYNRWLYTSSKRVRPLGPLLFEVIVNYEAITEGRTGFYDEPVSPLALPPERSWSFAVSSMPVKRDISSPAQPICNSAGEPFDPEITQEIYDLVYRIVKNQPYFNALLAYQYIGAVNTDVFQGFPAGTVRCTVFTGEEIFTPYLVYYRVTYEFQIRWDGWMLKVIDQGLREYMGVLPDGTPDLQNIVDRDDKEITEPQNLDGTGRKLDVGATPVVLSFKVHQEWPFAVLGLG